MGVISGLKKRSQGDLGNQRPVIVMTTLSKLTYRNRGSYRVWGNVRLVRNCKGKSCLMDPHSKERSS